VRKQRHENERTGGGEVRATQRREPTEIIATDRDGGVRQKADQQQIAPLSQDLHQRQSLLFVSLIATGKHGRVVV
jgi:hypothetical protein